MIGSGSLFRFGFALHWFWFCVLVFGVFFGFLGLVCFRLLVSVGLVVDFGWVLFSDYF